MHVKIGFAAVTIGALAICPALAQVTPTPTPGTNRVIPEKQGAPIQNGRSDSLSKKLSNSGGVITPGGNVDPGIKVPIPAGQSRAMPVIPPSATGGETAK